MLILSALKKIHFKIKGFSRNFKIDSVLIVTNECLFLGKSHLELFGRMLHGIIESVKSKVYICSDDLYLGL